MVNRPSTASEYHCLDPLGKLILATNSGRSPGAWRYQYMLKLLKLNPEALQERRRESPAFVTPPPDSSSRSWARAPEGDRKRSRVRERDCAIARAVRTAPVRRNTSQRCEQGHPREPTPHCPRCGGEGGGGLRAPFQGVLRLQLQAALSAPFRPARTRARTSLARDCLSRKPESAQIASHQAQAPESGQRRTPGEGGAVKLERVCNWRVSVGGGGGKGWPCLGVTVCGGGVCAFSSILSLRVCVCAPARSHLSTICPFFYLSHIPLAPHTDTHTSRGAAPAEGAGSRHRPGGSRPGGGSQGSLPFCARAPCPGVTVRGAVIGGGVRSAQRAELQRDPVPDGVCGDGDSVLERRGVAGSPVTRVDPSQGLQPRSGALPNPVPAVTRVGDGDPGDGAAEGDRLRDPPRARAGRRQLHLGQDTWEQRGDPVPKQAFNRVPRESIPPLSLACPAPSPATPAETHAGPEPGPGRPTAPSGGAPTSPAQPQRARRT
ncbi:uncharacterized protein LOC142821073 [Pelodiscus sinensis]|uniref:uncharacterized protein LOC142821073 n=1 Tax=Pelodiscus sinensis TaxID=13735 RepID=UPI003F6D1FB3